MQDRVNSKSSVPKSTGTSATISAGGALLMRLKALGVDYVFANAGTDFPPLIESLAEAAIKQDADAAGAGDAARARGHGHGARLLSGDG